jgi:hypothetical protein
MSREVVVAAAQLGPIARGEQREDVVDRLLVLLGEAAGQGAQLVVFPELALTTFFPRWWITDAAELDAFFETEMPGPATKPLFDEAARLGVGFHLGYAELTPDGHRYNSAVLVERDGTIVGHYRKAHLPGHEEHEPWRPFQHLERRYFDPGPDGFSTHDAFDGVVGIAICNDRRWPETYRVMGLQGVELVLVGYNTPVHYPPDPGQDHLAAFHNNLVMASGAYQNGTWVVGVAKAGVEEGVEMLADSQIIAPSGEVVARCTTTGDEVAVAACDLDRCLDYRRTVFDFARYRRPELYGAITEVSAAADGRGVEGGRTTEVLVNPLRVRRRARPSLEANAAVEFHRRLPGYQPTPLVSAPALAADLGLDRLWVKVESSRLGLPSFKVLGASWATYRLLLSQMAARGLAEPAWSDIDELRAAISVLGPLTLAAATDGNHGRAVARMARDLGLSARIFVPQDMVPARISAIESEGADVVVVLGTYDDAVRASAADPDVLVVSDTSWEGYVDVPAWVIEGYGTIFAEVRAQLDGEVPDVVVAQMGVGALCAATAMAYAAESRVVAVEPRSAACGFLSAANGAPATVPRPHHSVMSGLNCGNVSLVAWPTVAAGVDVFVAIGDSGIPSAMRDLADIGVEAGETGAAGLAGLQALISAGGDVGSSLENRSVLVLCTEGATDPVAYERIVGAP